MKYLSGYYTDKERHAEYPNACMFVEWIRTSPYHKEAVVTLNIFASPEAYKQRGTPLEIIEERFLRTEDYENDFCGPTEHSETPTDSLVDIAIDKIANKQNWSNWNIKEMEET